MASEILPARCGGCGHGIRVSSRLAGRRARCPSCGGVIAIPAAAELVSDDMLPEVARDADAYPVEIVSDTSALRSVVPEAAPPPPPRESTRRRRRGTGRSSRGGYAPPRSSPAVLGIAILGGVLALVAIGVAVSRAGRGGAEGPPPAQFPFPPAPSLPPAPAAPPPAEFSAEDMALRNRTAEYLQAFNRRDVLATLKFHAYEPAEERAMRAAVFGLLEREARHDEVTFTSAKVEGETGTVTFSSSGGRTVTIRWRRVEGTWLIPDRP